LELKFYLILRTNITNLYGFLSKVSYLAQIQIGCFQALYTHRKNYYKIAKFCQDFAILLAVPKENDIL
jgi:hypothetical protein